jgi:hypothetical protein
MLEKLEIMGKIKENRIKLEKAGKIGTLGPRCAYGSRLQGGRGTPGLKAPVTGTIFNGGRETPRLKAFSIIRLSAEA